MTSESDRIVDRVYNPRHAQANDAIEARRQSKKHAPD